MAALAEMYVQGVSTRKVKAITEELCGHSFSASSISAINQRLDASLAQFAGRPMAEAFRYLILDARYERVRESGVITSQTVLIAIGMTGTAGVRCWRSSSPIARAARTGGIFLLGLEQRGLHGVEFRCGRRSRGAQSGTARGPGGGGLPALLRAFLKKRARLRAAGSIRILV